MFLDLLTTFQQNLNHFFENGPECLGARNTESTMECFILFQAAYQPPLYLLLFYMFKTCSLLVNKISVTVFKTALNASVREALSQQ